MGYLAFWPFWPFGPFNLWLFGLLGLFCFWALCLLGIDFGPFVILPLLLAFRPLAFILLASWPLGLSGFWTFWSFRAFGALEI
jgi:hypothetical protein